MRRQRSVWAKGLKHKPHYEVRALCCEAVGTVPAWVRFLSRLQLTAEALNLGIRKKETAVRNLHQVRPTTFPQASEHPPCFWQILLEYSAPSMPWIGIQLTALQNTFRELHLIFWQWDLRSSTLRERESAAGTATLQALGLCEHFHRLHQSHFLFLTFATMNIFGYHTTPTKKDLIPGSSLFSYFAMPFPKIEFYAIIPKTHFFFKFIFLGKHSKTIFFPTYPRIGRWWKFKLPYNFFVCIKVLSRLYTVPASKSV